MEDDDLFYRCHLEGLTNDTYLYGKEIKQTYLSYEDDSTFLTTLIPVKEDGSSVIYGCSWDVSTVIEILDLTKTLPEDCSLSLTKVIEKNPMYKLVNQLRSA